jgi:hypothetical protein
MRLKSIVRVAFVAALVCSLGCNSNNKGKIEGTKWTSLATSMNVKGKGMTEIPAGLLKLEFTKDGKVAYTVGPMVLHGTYSLGWGDSVTLRFDQELEGRKTHTEKVTISGDKLTMTDTDGTAISFSRTQ